MYISNALTVVAFGGQNILSHAMFKISDEHPQPFIGEVPPGIELSD